MRHFTYKHTRGHLVTVVLDHVWRIYSGKFSRGWEVQFHFGNKIIEVRPCLDEVDCEDFLRRVKEAMSTEAAPSGPTG